MMYSKILCNFSNKVRGPGQVGYRITELQGLEGTSRDHRVQPHCKTGPLLQAAQVGIQVGLEHLQRRRIHNLPGLSVPVLCHLHCEEVPSHIGAELPMLQFMAVKRNSQMKEGICCVLRKYKIQTSYKRDHKREDRAARKKIQGDSKVRATRDLLRAKLQRQEVQGILHQTHGLARTALTLLRDRRNPRCTSWAGGLGTCWERETH